jgi:hypothetical protein
VGLKDVDWIELVLVCIEHEKLADRIPYTSCSAESTGLQDYYGVVPMMLSKRRIVTGAIWWLMWRVTRQVNSTDFNRINWPYAREQVVLRTVPILRANLGEFPEKKNLL